MSSIAQYSCGCNLCCLRDRRRVLWFDWHPRRDVIPVRVPPGGQPVTAAVDPPGGVQDQRGELPGGRGHPPDIRGVFPGDTAGVVVFRVADVMMRRLRL